MLNIANQFSITKTNSTIGHTDRASGGELILPKELFVLSGEFLLLWFRLTGEKI